MSKPEEDKEEGVLTPTDMDVAVIIGRFQVAELHQEHVRLIESVTQEEYRKVILFLGVAPQVSKRNPLGYIPREKMIREEFPEVTVAPLPDQPSDEQWSRELDRKIRQLSPHGSVTIFGGRDSFIPYYSGSFRTMELEGKYQMSGTVERHRLSREVPPSRDFRAGVIYGVTNARDRINACTDVALLQTRISAEGGWSQNPKLSVQVLLGRKAQQDKWRFPGGHVDPGDSSYEASAARELKEETGVEVAPHKLTYIGSDEVKDWRATEDSVYMSSFFMAEAPQSATPAAGSDLDEVQWFPYEALAGNCEVDIREEHQKLLLLLLSALDDEDRYVTQSEEPQ